VLTDLRDFVPAKACLDSVLLINKKLGNTRGVSEALMNLGFLEARQSHFDAALRNYQESIRLAKITNYNIGLAWCQWGIGDIYFRQGKFAPATEYLDVSEGYGLLTNANELLILNYNTRRDLLAAQQNFKGIVKIFNDGEPT
jgi:tetratricopeptide (TPR) repeat protein